MDDFTVAEHKMGSSKEGCRLRARDTYSAQAGTACTPFLRGGPRTSCPIMRYLGSSPFFKAQWIDHRCWEEMYVLSSPSDKAELSPERSFKAAHGTKPSRSWTGLLTIRMRATYPGSCGIRWPLGAAKEDTICTRPQSPTRVLRMHRCCKKKRMRSCVAHAVAKAGPKRPYVVSLDDHISSLYLCCTSISKAGI